MWQLLGIAPTTDTDRIRSAFRAGLLALKRAGRHEDLAAVQPLRQAYERALQWAAAHANGAGKEGETDGEGRGVNAGTGNADNEGSSAAASTSATGKQAGARPAGVPPIPNTVPDMLAAALRTRYYAALHLLRAWRTSAPARHAPDVHQPTAWSTPGAGTGQPPEPPRPTQGQDDARQASSHSKAAVALLLGHGLAAHLPRKLANLLRQPRWQQPQHAQALQYRLATRMLALHAELPQPLSDARALQATQRWQALTLAAAERWHWWPATPAGQPAAFAPAAALWRAFCASSAGLLLHLTQRGLPRAACHTLDRLLRHPAMQPLDSRAEWLAHLAQCLAEHLDDHQAPPPWQFVGHLIQAFGLADLAPGEHPWPAVDALVCGHRTYRSQTLLQRVAQGHEVHATLSPEVAAALLQPTVSDANRHAVRRGLHLHGQPWLPQMRQAIHWLHANAPEALGATEPPVLRWWRAPHVLPRDWWLMALLLAGCGGGVAGLAAFHAAFTGAFAGDQATALLLAVLLLSVLVCAGLGAWLGWHLARGLTWLRLQWHTLLYPAWRRQDAALARRIPLIGPLLPKLGVWLSRDLLVLWALFQAFGPGWWAPLLAFAGWRLLLRWADGGVF